MDLCKCAYVQIVDKQYLSTTLIYFNHYLLQVLWEDSVENIIEHFICVNILIAFITSFR